MIIINKWYRHNPESILENKTQKILWDFEIKINHPIKANLLTVI